MRHYTRAPERRKKGSQPRLAALSSPFQGKGLAWMLPPSFGRRCPEGAEVGGGKRYPRHTAFPAWGRCPEGADRAALRYIPHCSITAGMPLLPSALPPKGEARRYVANDFLNLIALLREGATHFTLISKLATLLSYFAPHHQPEPGTLNPTTKKTPAFADVFPHFNFSFKNSMNAFVTRLKG